MIIKKLSELKASKKMTNQQISDLSKVPLSTVNRIFSGQTENPNIQTIADIVGAMGGSLDELLGIQTPTQQEAQVQKETPVQKEPSNQAEVIELYKEIIRSKDKAIKIMGGVLVGVVAVILIVLIIDVLNGGSGYVRY